MLLEDHRYLSRKWILQVWKSITGDQIDVRYVKFGEET